MSGGITTFLEGLYNIATIYLPHTFATKELLTTLFLPWKGIVFQKKQRGFSFQDEFNIWIANAIGIGIGFSVRISVLVIFIIFELLFMLSLPIVIISYTFLQPVQILLGTNKLDPKEKRSKMLEQFISKHVIDNSYINSATEWFNKEYDEYLKKFEWWTKENLTSGKPFASGWSNGFTPILDEYTTFIPRSNVIIGRINEQKELEAALIKQSGANALLVGEDGIGKKTIITLFSDYINTEEAHELIRYKRVIIIDIDKILSSVEEQKQREAIFETILFEAQKSHDVILVIPNIQNYLHTSETTVDLSLVLTKFAQIKDIHIIGLTTPLGYEQYVSKQVSLHNMFSKINVTELSKSDTQTILEKEALVLENTYKQIITIDAIEEVIEKAGFYITNGFFPKKALMVLENICVNNAKNNEHTVITPHMIDTEISKITQAPTELTTEIKHDLINLEDQLSKKVIGQDTASREVASALRRSYMLLGKRKKPLASFLFLGPTGVGKTETAKALATIMFDNKEAFLRFDMSTFQSKEDIPKLIGDNTKNSPGLLTTAIAEHPYGILLLDELEKAHKDLFNLFLTILDEGYLVDGFGSHVDCKNLIIIATSNAGIDFIYKKQSENSIITSDELTQILIDEKYFAPEFLNRFDGIIAFNPLSNESAHIIAKNMIQSISHDIAENHNITLKVKDETIKEIVTHNFNAKYGARNLDRALRLSIEDTVAKHILEGSIQSGDIVEV